MLERFWYFAITLTFKKLRLYESGFGYAGSLDIQVNSLHPSTLVSKCTDKLAVDFKTIRSQVNNLNNGNFEFYGVIEQACEPLATFLDFLTHSYMIDNVILIVTGALHERDINVCVFYYINNSADHDHVQRNYLASAIHLDYLTQLQVWLFQIT
jgi:hypothetical protein